jgi:hypothetical protein
MLRLTADPDHARQGHARGREVCGWVEAKAFEQRGVGYEAQEVGEVGRSARGPVAGGLGDDPGGHGRQCRQLGVDLGFPAEGEQRDPGRLETALAQGVERRLPRRAALVHSDQDGAHAVQRRGWRGGVEADAAVGPNRRKPRGQGLDRRSQGEQLEVVVGDDEDHRWPSAGGCAPRPHRRAARWRSPARAARSLRSPRSEQSSHRAPLAAAVFHHRQQVVRR